MNIHTFELFAPLNVYDYQSLSEYLFYLARSSKRCTYRKQGVVHCNYWNHEGVTISLKTSQYGSYIHLRINPCETTGDYNPLSTFAPDKKKVGIITNVLNQIFKVFPVSIRASDFAPFRVDLCNDVIVPESVCMEYIRLLRKKQVPQAWVRPCYNSDDDRHIFRAENGRYIITVYDKLYQIAKSGQLPQQQANGKVLRMEVALLRDGLRRIYKKPDNRITAKLSWTEQICLLSEIGATIMEKRFNKIALQAPYVTLAEASKVINSSSFSQSKKAELIDFIENINRYKTVDIAQIRASSNGNNRLSQLSRLGINPITIEARARIDILPSPQQLLRGYPLWS